MTDYELAHHVSNLRDGDNRILASGTVQLNREHGRGQFRPLHSESLDKLLPSVTNLGTINTHAIQVDIPQTRYYPAHKISQHFALQLGLVLG